MAAPSEIRNTRHAFATAVRPRRGRLPVGLATTILILGALTSGMGPFSGSRLARADEIDEALALHRREVVETLYDLFKSCRSGKLYILCNELAQEILTYDEDHEKARRWLNYRRRGDSWVQDKPPPKRRNWSREALEHYPDRRRKALAPIAESLFDVLGTLGGRERQGQRAEVLDTLLSIAPHDARFRQANGEVEHRGRWVLDETRRTLETEWKLQRGAQDVLDQTPAPERAPTPTTLRRYRLPWAPTYRGRRVMACSTWGWEEADGVVRHCQAAETLFQQAFASLELLPKAFTVGCVQGKDEKRTIVAPLRITPTEKKRLMSLSGFWIPKTDTVIEASEDAQRRLDGAVRQALNQLMKREFGRFGRLGWASEGIGIYLTHLLTGTRLTYFVRRTEYGEGPSRKRLSESDADWLAIAKELMEADELPELPYVMGVDLNALTVGDMLMAHAFAAFLLTARPQQAAPFLHATARGTKTNEAAIQVLGLDLRLLDRRIRRWLAEVR